MATLQIITETYSRTASGKSWRSSPDRVKVETMPWRTSEDDSGVCGEERHRLLAGRDTLQFFRSLGGSEYAVRSYTGVGYIVTRLISTSPDRRVRTIRKFSII